MKLRPRVLLMATLLLMQGCATQYSVTEGELERYLNDELSREYQTAEGEQISAQMTLADISVNIDSDAVSIDTRSSFKVKTPLMPLRADLNLSFSAVPWYDRQDHGLYLKNVTLQKVEARPEQLEEVLVPLSREVMEFVRLYLENQPVYKLDDKGWKEELLRDFAQEIQLKPGKLELVLKP